MPELYPLLMLPEFSPRPWGTLDLSPIYPHRQWQEKIGEAWLTGDECRVANGPLAGQQLGELTRSYGRELVGEAAREPDRFPLLTKFLFPHDKLSVQVHPDDACAQKVGLPWGKTECWYVLDAHPGARVALGLKPGTTRALLEQAIRENRAEDLLNWMEVHAGDMIYVAGGTVHAIAAGSILVETQQSSDTTYRLYDYGRPRPLHLERGLEAVKEKTGSGKVVGREPTSSNGLAQLIASPFFVVDRISVGAETVLNTVEAPGVRTAHILVALDGCGVVDSGTAQPVTFARGDAVVVPAGTGEYRIRPQWNVQVLRSRVPAHPLPEPVTAL
jgi:mannose-6-phosphate isomerase